MANIKAWRGTQQLVPGKAEWNITAQKISVSLSWSGPYENCLANRPQIGDAVTGYAPALRVTQSKVTEGDGTTGKIAVTIEAAQDTSQFGFALLGPPVYELEFGELSRPLEQHSRCGKIKPSRPGPDGVKKLTWDDWADFKEADYDDSGSGEGIWGSTAKWPLATYQAMKRRGQDSYILYTPILRRTTLHFSPPPDVGSAAGRIQFPPAAGFAGVSSWDWLAGPDRCTQNGRIFTRLSEWHGADYWDRDVYTA